jgi:4-hydroxybenzoate polyprenyltransferase
MTTWAKLLAIGDLIRIKRQYGTALLLCPTLWSLFMASDGAPSLKNLFVFIAAAFLMRSAGCVVNDMADMRFDARVERTRTRPLADGRLKPWEAGVVFCLLIGAAFLLALMLEPLVLILGGVALVLAVVYPFVKRVSFFPQVFLGAAFGWGAVMAWAAATGEVAFTAILIFIANIFFSTAYDTIYALMDIEDDKKIGVRSTAIFFGDKVLTIVSLLYIVMALCLVLAGATLDLGIVYYIGLAVALVYFLSLVAELRDCTAEEFKECAFSVFTRNSWGGAVILLAIIIDMNL